MKKINNIFSKSKNLTLPTFMPPCLGGPDKTSIPTTLEPTYPSTTTTYHSDSLASLSSCSSFSSSSPSSSSFYSPSSSSFRHVSGAPVRWVMVRPRFAWYEMLLAMSFGVPVALLSVTYENVGNDLVPAKLFASNPRLFYVFVILDALAFTASLIGFWLHTMHAKTSKYLSLFAFASLMVSFTVYLWVLLPSYLKWFPCVLLVVVMSVLLYVHLGKGNNHHLDEYCIY